MCKECCWVIHMTGTYSIKCYTWWPENQLLVAISNSFKNYIASEDLAVDISQPQNSSSAKYIFKMSLNYILTSISVSDSDLKSVSSPSSKELKTRMFSVTKWDRWDYVRELGIWPRLPKEFNGRTWFKPGHIIFKSNSENTAETTSSRL